MLPTVAIITITRARPVELLRCIESVRNQQYRGGIRHVIVVDDHDAMPAVSAAVGDIEGLELRLIETSKLYDRFDEVYIPSRLAFLRNCGIDSCASDVICYLDDDNYMDPDHVQRLVETLLSDSSTALAFSWRRLCLPNGDPYLRPEYPWTPDARLAIGRPQLSKYIYEELVAGGIRTPGSNIVRDAVLDSRGIAVYTVDTNEMMYWRSLHATYPNVVRYSWREMVGDFSDDYALVRRWHTDGVIIVPTRRATVTYTVGGVSNSDA